MGHYIIPTTYIICDAIMLRSFGKIIFKLRINGFDRNKKNKLIWQIVIRNISRFIPFDFIFLFFNKDNKSLHDLLSKTKVII